MEDVGAKAEDVIKSLLNKDNKLDLTTGQIRKFLTAVNSLTSKIDVYKAQNEKIEELPENLKMEVKYLKVKIAYQAGRDKKCIARNNVLQFFKRLQNEKIIRNFAIEKKGEFPQAISFTM